MPLSDVPDASVEIAFATNPGATPTWSDVTEYVRAFHTDRGRQTELDRTEAGTGSIVLQNWDRRFEPENPSSPYSPNVVPMRRIRVRGTWDNATHDIFNGFVESWTPRYQEGGFNEIVEVPVVDAFKALALAKISASYPQEASGVRVGKVLDDAGWPAAERSVDAGQAIIPASTLDKAPALQHLQDVAIAELGLLFATRSGILRFMERTAFFGGLEDYPNHTWGDLEDGVEWLYRDVVLAFDDASIWNDLRITRQGGIEQVAIDSASQTKYLRRTLTATGVLVATDNEALDIANYWVNRYKEVDLRVVGLGLRPAMHPAQWTHVLHAELGDRIRVRRRPREGGLIEQTAFIQGIAHSWDGEAGTWDVKFRLSPVDAAANFWMLDSPTRSVLDSTTKLGV